MAAFEHELDATAGLREALFHAISTDRAAITLEDLMGMLTALDASKPHDEIQASATQLMGILDTNHSGQVSFAEFEAAVADNESLVRNLASLMQLDVDVASNPHTPTESQHSGANATLCKSESLELMFEAREAELREQLDAALQQIQQERTENQAILSTQSQRHDREVTSLNQQLTEQEQAIQDYRQEIDALRDTIRANEADQRERNAEEGRALMEEQQATLASLTDKVKSLKVDVLHNRLQVQEEYAQTLEQKYIQLQEAANELVDLRAENRQLKDRLDEFQAPASTTAMENETRTSSEEHGRALITADADLEAALSQQRLKDIMTEHDTALLDLSRRHRHERARLQVLLVAARLKGQAQDTKMSQVAETAAQLRYDKKRLQLQVDALGASLQAMKNMVDQTSVVSRKKHNRIPSWSGVLRRRSQTSSRSESPAPASPTGQPEAAS
ncbi:uncharacterized protein MONBRDRAFT_31168 [Monosiga brevicollis MX1]|uniref:EF-hand domain-containing protein n=1 Tax=Monosiga brevicollis TaxID=81824 RepID=A9US51_MONBE|nr:uncharacterized protein MONBRDRAFT_31168 [Monosiga brevicollis MX1]EDQ91719.1 predicted protein [Monosiga brevicollis MX1]|eukprot:XP_001743005.1 hypothetical protein [Monosiga brevicollis MX1]